MKSYKITHLSITFVVLVALAAAIMLAVILRHMDSLSVAQDEFESNEAKKELSLALEGIDNYIKTVRTNINDWGETKQQFVNREFYQLWKETRVSDSGILPAEFYDLALYDEQGEIFATPNKNIPMPLSIIEGQSYLQKFIRNNDESWLYIFPISAVDLTGLNEDKKIILGYGGIIFSLKKMLSSVSDFKFIDIDSVRTVYENESILLKSGSGE